MNFLWDKTLILTKDGIFQLKDLEGRSALPSGMKKVSSIRNQNPLKIFFHGGQWLSCGPDQVFTVKNKDTFTTKKASEIKKGDNIPRIPKVRKLNFGKIGNKDEGFIAGIVWAQRKTGSISSYRFGMDFESHDECKQRVEKYLDGKNIPYQSDAYTVWILTPKGDIRNPLEKHGIFTPKNGLPSGIWTTSSDSFRSGFFNGVFSHLGTVKRPFKFIEIVSDDKEFLRGLSRLLSFYGINSDFTPEGFFRTHLQSSKWLNNICGGLTNTLLSNRCSRRHVANTITKTLKVLKVYKVDVRLCEIEGEFITECGMVVNNGKKN